MQSNFLKMQMPLESQKTLVLPLFMLLIICGQVTQMLIPLSIVPFLQSIVVKIKEENIFDNASKKLKTNK